MHIKILYYSNFIHRNDNKLIKHFRVGSELLPQTTSDVFLALV